MTTTAAFIAKWAASGAAERANAQLFVADLCALLGVEAPQPKTPDEQANAYVFEKTIPGAGGNKNFIDCYKRGFFVLEAKQGADAATGDAPLSEAGEQRLARRKTGHGQRGTAAWDTAMERARKQAENYARRLPAEEIAGNGRPPFLLVADVGHSIALYADWSRAGGHYTPFPDPASYRIALDDLHRDEILERLRLVWTDPLALDPSRRSARVTRQIADRLARLARSLEGGHDPEKVAGFLMRSLFTMFAEDVGLLPERSFSRLLDEFPQDPINFPHLLEALWRDMNTGGYSVALRARIPRFNGGLFAQPEVIELNADQVQLLAEAARADWRDVEPAIFGTLLERALDPRERHKLGAHYTPRAYVERLVQPTVIEPLRAEWQAVQTAALQHAQDAKPEKAIAEVEAYLHRLASLRILDPACGTGNFLYVTLELLKRLEGEVLNTLRELGQGQQSL
ncbi:MAG: type IIL restriction-modification enzyme MmeI, partial [Saprospiraceae bacterium]